MPISAREFGPTTGFERIRGPRGAAPDRPELGGDISTERDPDESATLYSYAKLPTFKPSDTSDIEPPTVEFDEFDDETPPGLSDPDASATPGTGLERRGRTSRESEGPSDLETAFGLARLGTSTAKRAVEASERPSPTPNATGTFPGLVPFALSEQDYGLRAGGGTPSESFEPETAQPWPLDLDVISGRSGGSVYAPDLSAYGYETDFANIPGAGEAPAAPSPASGALGILGGLMQIGQTAARGGDAAQQGLGTAAGALQAYQGLSRITNLPSVPYANIIGPVLSATGGMSGAPNAETAAAQGGLALARGALDFAVPGLSTLFAPAFEGIGNTISRAFSDPSHEERETLEANKAIAAARGMARDVQYATTPEDLQAVIDRYGAGFGGHTIGADNWDPMAFEAQIRAGVDPSYLAEANAALSQAVQQQARAFTLAQQGHPEALAYLEQQGQAGQGFREELLQLMDPERVGFARRGPGYGPVTTTPDPYEEALLHLAYADNDIESVREAAHQPPIYAGQPVTGYTQEGVPQYADDANRGEIPQPIATLIEAGILPATSRLPDTLTEYFGLPRGAQVPLEEYRRLLDWFSSGGA